jgi:hypothetical protein
MAEKDSKKHKIKLINASETIFNLKVYFKGPMITSKLTFSSILLVKASKLEDEIKAK